MLVESLEQWKEIADILSRTGFRKYQTQYTVNDPEGYQARFFLSGAPIFEVVTHNQQVYEAIIKYKPEH